jgi:hypothetical protein
MTPVEQLRAMIARLPGATTAVFGGYSSPAILDFDGQAWGPDGQAQVGGEVITLTYVYPDLPGLAPGVSVIAGGASFVITAGPRRKGDGLEAVVLLEEQP